MGQSANLYAASLILLGLAVLPTVTAIAGRRLLMGPVGVGALAMAATFVGLGVANAVSIASGNTQEMDAARIAAYLWLIGWPALILLAVLLSAGAISRARAIAAVLLALASPLPLYLVVSISYLSHDTVPWTEAIGGLLLILAGGLLAGGPSEPDPVDTPAPAEQTRSVV